jgi:hypothetical protein
MISVAQMEKKLREVFETRANHLARETGFIVRERAFSGADFVQGLVFGWLHKPQARVEELAQYLSRRDVQISGPGLHQRFTQKAADFMQAVLGEVVGLVVKGEKAPIDLLQRFSSVVLEDSSVITLPDCLQEQWRGCGGGAKQSKAGLKLHVRYDLLDGSLQGPMLTAGRVADQRSPLRSEPLASGQLYITDEGYFGLQWLKEKTAEDQRYFLTRPRYNTAFFDEQGSRLDLQSMGPKQVGRWLDQPVLVGKKVRLSARLIMLRVPDEVVKERQEHIRETARKHSCKPTQEQLALAQWTILITNVPVDVLCVSEVLVLQRARWQIERLFRLWKEDGLIDEWRTTNPWRILCETYAKLIAMVIQQWLLLRETWHDPYRSLVKAAKVIRDQALDLIDVLMAQMPLARLLRRLSTTMRTGCRVNRRAQDPCLAQLFLEGLDWLLT